MDSRAQISLEAILVLAAALLVAAWFISAYTDSSSKAAARVKSNSKKTFDLLRKKS